MLSTLFLPCHCLTSCSLYTPTTQIKRSWWYFWIFIPITQREKVSWKSLHPKCRGAGAGGADWKFIFFLSLQILFWVKSQPKSWILQLWNGCGQRSTSTAGLTEMRCRWQESCSSNLTKFDRKISQSALSAHQGHSCTCGETISALSYLTIPNL